MCSAKNKNLQELIILKSVLKAAREKKGLTAEELADIFCLKEWHITEIEEADTFLPFIQWLLKLKLLKDLALIWA